MPDSSKLFPTPISILLSHLFCCCFSGCFGVSFPWFLKTLVDWVGKPTVWKTIVKPEIKNPRCWKVCLPGKQEEEGKSVSEKSEKDDMSNWVIEDFFSLNSCHLLSLVKIFSGFSMLVTFHSANEPCADVHDGEFPLVQEMSKNKQPKMKEAGSNLTSTSN